MSNFMQIDPESLALHVNASILSGSKYAENYFHLLDFCNLGNFQDAVKQVKGVDNYNERRSSVEFLSQYVHEFRHHVDLLLSPYGWYRLRHNLEVLCNILFLTHSEKFPILPIPISVAANPLDLQFLGLSLDDVGDLPKMAVPIDSRRSLINQDNSPIAVPDGSYISIGGESILEALAYYSQRAWIGMNFREFFDDPYFDYLIRPKDRGIIDDMYNWPARAFSPLLFKKEYKIDNSFKEPFVTGLLLICLNGSVLPEKKSLKELKKISEPLSFRYVNDLFPSYRVTELLDVLDNMTVNISTSQELFDTLMTVSHEVFGRSYIEELEIDIKLNEDYIEEVYSEFEHHPHTAIRSIINHYRTLTHRRKELFNRLLENPLDFIVPHLFTPQVEQSWSPDIIYYFNRGIGENSRISLSRINIEWIAIHSLTTERSEENDTQKLYYAFWARPIILSDEMKESDEVNGKSYFYGYFIPIYKFLMYGFSYNSMSEIELVHGHDLLKRHRKFVIDPEFEKVNNLKPSSSLFSFINRKSIVCDRCNNEILEDEYIIVSPLTVRKNELFWSNLKEYVVSTSMNKNKSMEESHAAILFEEVFGTDWSDWCLCDSCIRQFGF